MKSTRKIPSNQGPSALDQQRAIAAESPFDRQRASADIRDLQKHAKRLEKTLRNIDRITRNYSRNDGDKLNEIGAMVDSALIDIEASTAGRG